MTLETPRSTLAGLLSLGARTLSGLASTVRPDGGGGHRTLVLGGARSGKSRHAEKLLGGYDEVRYVATGEPASPADPDWAARLRAHQERRPAHWRTIETVDIAAALRGADVPVLVDCFATWLTRLYDHVGAWQGAPGWQERAEGQITGLLEAWQSAAVPVVAVSNEVGSGVVPETPAGRLFRDGLGTLNQRVAAASDSVVLVVAGMTMDMKERS